MGSGEPRRLGLPLLPSSNALVDMGRVEDGGGGEGAADLEHVRFEWRWDVLVKQTALPATTETPIRRHRWLITD